MADDPAATPPDEPAMPDEPVDGEPEADAPEPETADREVPAPEPEPEAPEPEPVHLELPEPAETVVVQAAPAAATAGTWMPWVQARSADTSICPFLRAIGEDDVIGFPIPSPDVANRCAAMREPVPQSLRQQELVCLTSSHVSCPRYLRGSLAASGEVAPVRPRTRSALTPAISVALVLLGLSFAVSVAFGVSNGGLSVATPPGIAEVSPSAAAATPATASSAVATPAVTPATSFPGPTPTTTPPPSASPSASTSPSTSPSASTSVSPSPSSSAIASATPTPKPTRSPTPRPSSGRYALLTPCPGDDDCWIYRIRAGDNLYSIANYFGVPLRSVRAMNPWVETRSLRAGQKLRIPPPTR